VGEGIPKTTLKVPAKDAPGKANPDRRWTESITAPFRERGLERSFSVP